MTKENVYDQQINPLVAEIIEICKTHKIAFVASFCLDKETDFHCTSAMTTEDFEPSDALKSCVKVLFPESKMFQVTKKNADGTIEVAMICD